MTLNEFSDAFDIKLASYILNNNFGESNKLSFDEYEKSVFLSQAQEEIILELYSGRNNKGISFESNEESRRLLHSLVRVKEYKSNVILANNTIKPPKDLWFIVYEYCIIGTKEIPVIPVKQDDLHKILNNPFKRPSKKRVLRIDDSDGDIKLLVQSDNISKYSMTYLKKPYPIILSDFDDLSVLGETTPEECEVDSSLHSSIVDRAVAFAIKSRALLLNNKQ